MRQTTLPSDWVSGAEASSSSEGSSSFEEVKKPRGAALQWTRVKSLSLIKTQRVTAYNAEEDLKFDRKLKTIRKELDQARGEFTFDPGDFKDVAGGFTEEAYRLPEQGLLEYARVAT